MTKRVFISFDYDHDEELKHALIGQSRNSDSPFSISDWSVKEELSGDWKEKVRTRLRRVDVIAVICGHWTDRATGVSTEVRIAREEGYHTFSWLVEREGPIQEGQLRRWIPIRSISGPGRFLRD